MSVVAGGWLSLGWSGVEDASTLYRKDCSEPHDAEIAYKGHFTATAARNYREEDSHRFCLDYLPPEYLDLAHGSEFRAATIVGDSVSVDHAEEGWVFLCYLEAADGSKLDEPLVRSER